METLADRVLECVQETTETIPEHDQRSAIGMARSWLDNGQLLTAKFFESQFKRRDELAEKLVEIVKDADREDAIEALAAARAWLNAPYADPTMRGMNPGKAMPKGTRHDQPESAE